MKKAFIYILMALMLVFSVMAAPEFSVFPSDETVEVGEEYNALIDVEFDGPVLLTIVGVPDGMSMSQVPNDDGNSATLEWTPSVDQNGDSFDIELTACEFYYDMDDEDCVTHEFTLTVEGGFIVAEPVFNPLFDDTNPYITTEAVTSVLLGETYEYDVNALDLDGNDGLSLVYSLSTYPTDMTMDSEGLIQWTPTELGDFDVVVEVEDNDGNVVTQEFTITVTENNAPVITEIADQTATEGDAFSLTGDATDDDVVTFTLSVVDADSNDVSADFTLTDNGDNTFTIDYTAVEGVYTVTVTADDGEYTDTEEFVLTVSAASTNNVPVITEIADQNVDVGSDFSLSGSATDADGDVVSFSISVLNADSVDVTSDFTFTDDGDNTFDISMSSAVEGVYTVTVTADDANGGVDTEEFTLTVESLSELEVLENSLDDVKDLIEDYEDDMDDFWEEAEEYWDDYDNGDEDDQDDAEDDLEDLEDEVEDLEDLVKDLEDELEAIEDDLDTYMDLYGDDSQTDDLEDDIEDYQDDIDDLFDDIDELLDYISSGEMSSSTTSTSEVPYTTYTSETTTTTSSTPGEEVEVLTSSATPTSYTPTATVSDDTEDDFMVYLIGGLCAIVFLIVVLLLVALFARK